MLNMNDVLIKLCAPCFYRTIFAYVGSFVRIRLHDNGSVSKADLCMYDLCVAKLIRCNLLLTKCTIIH